MLARPEERYYTHSNEGTSSNVGDLLFFAVGNSVMSDDCEVSAQLRQRFEFLAEEWKRDTAPLSSVADIVAHPSYQQVIAMGKAVIPLILEDLRDSHRQWFYALRLLGEENPVNSDDAGYVSRMVDSWLRWGQRRGYIDGVRSNVFVGMAS